MEKAIKELVENIIFLPVKFNSAENEESIYSLLKKTGYFEMHGHVDESDILESLNKFPKCADAWLSWSEDKRSDSGWYVKHDHGKYIVGYVSAKANVVSRSEYDDLNSACAVFVKNEIEDIRKS